MHTLSHLYIFDFEFSFLGGKHFAKNIVNSIGVSVLCNQAVLQANKGLNSLSVFIIGKI